MTESKFIFWLFILPPLFEVFLVSFWWVSGEFHENSRRASLGEFHHEASIVVSEELHAFHEFFLMCENYLADGWWLVANLINWTLWPPRSKRSQTTANICRTVNSTPRLIKDKRKVSQKAPTHFMATSSLPKAFAARRRGVGDVVIDDEQ